MTASSRPAVQHDPDSWQLGYQAGLDGLPNIPPPGVDRLAWHSGYVDGKGVDDMEREDWYADQRAAKGYPYL